MASLPILDAFIIYTTIIIIYFHTWKHTHITKETVQRRKGNLLSWKLSHPSQLHLLQSREGMVTMGHSIHLANLCMLLISRGVHI